MITWFRVTIKEISDDIRHGENLDVYVIMLVATLVLIVDITGYDKFTTSAVLAVLLLITYGQLNNKKLQGKHHEELQEIRRMIALSDSDSRAESQTGGSAVSPPPPLKRYDEDSNSIYDIAQELGAELVQLELAGKESTSSHDRYTVQLLADVKKRDDDYGYTVHKAGDKFVAVVHRQSRSLVSVTEIESVTAEVAAPTPRIVESSFGLAIVLSLLAGAGAMYLAGQLRNLVESTYSVYGAEVMTKPPTVVLVAIILIMLVPPWGFVWGAIAGQPTRIVMGGLIAYMIVMPLWADYAMSLGLFPFDSLLPRGGSQGSALIFGLLDFRAFFASSLVSSNFDPVASSVSVMLVHGIAIICFGILTAFLAFVIGEGGVLVYRNADTFFPILMALSVIASVMVGGAYLNDQMVKLIASSMLLPPGTVQPFVCTIPLFAILGIVLVGFLYRYKLRPWLAVRNSYKDSNRVKAQVDDDAFAD